MPQATYHFPRGFLWGTATAAYQVEGNNTSSNWYAWEQEPGRIFHGDKSGLACDWWNGRWREDFHRAAEGAQNAHRMSIEWSRIQPAPDRWDEDALNRYVDMVRGLVEFNMTPLITLHHYSDPQWFVEKGGWENEEAFEDFVKYVQKVVQALKDYVNLWCTFNEPNGYATLGFMLGLFPPGKKDTSLAFTVMVNMVRAHAAAYHAIHQIQPQARVGMANYYRSLQPAKTWFPLDSLVTNLLRSLNDIFPSAATDGVVRFISRRKRVPQAKGTQDFLGIDYYTRDYVSFNLFKSSELFGKRFFRSGDDLSTTGFLANVPLGMFEALKWGLKYNLPIIVTENGFDDSDDRIRPRYMVEHIHQIWRAVNFNWPIKGYFHWTLVDNFEWERGWSQRFGLWALDIETQARHKRASADLYAEICRENGISDDMVGRYAPAALPGLFPD
jgi:beta-glucosidase